MTLLPFLRATATTLLLATVPAYAQGNDPRSFYAEPDTQTPRPVTEQEKALLQREGYRIDRVPSDGVEASLAPAAGANGIPETIQGIWWITVNPLGYLLVSLGGETTWDAQKLTATQNLYGAGSFSFHDDDSGLAALFMFLRNHMRFVFTFSPDAKFATIDTTFQVLGKDITLPRSLLRYEMRWVGDGHFVRESWVLGQRFPDYQLRRVVQADGTRDAAYAAYLLNADQNSLVVGRAR